MRSHMLSTFLLLCCKLQDCLFLCSYLLLLILRSKVRKGAYLPFPDFCGLGDVMLEVKRRGFLFVGLFTFVYFMACGIICSEYLSL